MFPPDLFQPLLVEMAMMLDSRGVRFAVTGGLTSAFYGEPRYTQDADLVVDRAALMPIRDPVIADFVGAGYLFDATVVKEAIGSGRPFQLFHIDEQLKLDLYPRELVPGELSRSVQAELFPGVWLPVTSLPDLILSKLIWIHKGSHKSRSDLRKLMRATTRDAEAQVRRQAEELSLLPLFDEVLTEPDEIE